MSLFPISFSTKIHHSNDYLVEKIAFDTAESESLKVCIADLSGHTFRSHAARLIKWTKYKKMKCTRRHISPRCKWSPLFRKQTVKASRLATLLAPGFRDAGIVNAMENRERRLAKFRQNVARFRLYRLRFLQLNMRFAAFFKIYQILKLKFLKFDKILQIFPHNDLQVFCWNFTKITVFSNRFFAKMLRLQRFKSMQIL